MFCDVQRLKARVFTPHYFRPGGSHLRQLVKSLIMQKNANIGLPINQARQPQYDFWENNANREARCL